MKAKVTIEFEEDFINFVMREGNINSADELKGWLRGLYCQTVSDEEGIKDITVEVEE